MTTTNQKVNSNNYTREQLFKAISKFHAKAAATFVKDGEADWAPQEAHDGHGRTLCRHRYGQLWHDQRRPSEVPKWASKRVWSHQGLLGRKKHTAWTLAY